MREDCVCKEKVKMKDGCVYLMKVKMSDNYGAFLKSSLRAYAG